MRKQLTYIAPRQVGIMMGTIHGLLGLLLLPFVLLKAVLTSKVSGLEAIITCSIWVLLTLVLYAVVGFVGGILGALIYNVIAKRIGGIEFELRDLAPAGRFQPQYPVVTESLDSCNLIVGIWLGKAPNNLEGMYTFYADGNMQCEVCWPGGANRLLGHWDVDGDSILAKWDKGDTDIIKLNSPQQYRWTNAQFPGAVGIATRQ